MTDFFDFLYPTNSHNNGLSYSQVLLPDQISGTLFLGPVPCRYETKEMFDTWLIEKNISLVVCLLSDEDIRDRSPEYWYLIRKSGRKWEHRQFPIPDLGVPSDRDKYFHLACSVSRDLNNGRNTLIHCGAGIGRTGCLCMVVLRILGLSLKNAKTNTNSAGGCPENEVQWDLIRWCQQRISEGGCPEKG